MSRLGSYTGSQVVKALRRVGWKIVRTKGSHIILEKDGVEAILTVPVHRTRGVKRGTLRCLIKDSGLTVEEFVSLV